MCLAHVVVDASALVDFLLRPVPESSLATLMERPESELHTPALCGVEVAAALRRGVKRGHLPLTIAQEALVDLGDLPLNRYEHEPILRRVLELRDNFSAYDATYVALAEALGALFLTADRRLARAVRAHTEVEVIEATTWP
jgi:predicted nucleic acid-binding protein